MRWCEVANAANVNGIYHRGKKEMLEMLVALSRLPKQPLSFAIFLAVSFVRVQFLSRLETNCLARRNRDLLARTRISSDTALARLYDKDAKTPQLDAFTAGQRFLHRMKERVYGLFRLQFRDAGFVGKTIDDIKFNHEPGLQWCRSIADDSGGEFFFEPRVVDDRKRR